MTKLTRILAAMILWVTAAAHASTHHYYYTDPQGTVLAKADASGTIIATYDYAPYGTAVASMSPAPNGPGYTGHVNDPESGLVYMQARYYDPAVGRFLSVDPERMDAGELFKINRFVYGSDNPVNMVDPNGRDSLWVQNGGHTTITIPVHFVGAEADNKKNIEKIISMAKKLDILDRRYSVSIVSTDKAMSGVLNTMDLSKGYDSKKCQSAGECVNFRGGNLGHINTSNRDWLGAALHDILHFAAFKDGYLSKGSGDSRTFDGYLSGYSSDNIMSARDGTVISQSEIEDADDYGRGQKTNRICHYEATDDHHHALVCGF